MSGTSGRCAGVGVDALERVARWIGVGVNGMVDVFHVGVFKPLENLLKHIFCKYEQKVLKSLLLFRI